MTHWAPQAFSIAIKLEFVKKNCLPSLTSSFLFCQFKFKFVVSTEFRLSSKLGQFSNRDQVRAERFLFFEFQVRQKTLSESNLPLWYDTHLKYFT